MEYVILGLILGPIFLWLGRIAYKRYTIPSSRGSNSELIISLLGKISGCLQIVGGAMELLIVPALLIGDEVLVENIFNFGVFIFFVGLVGIPLLTLILMDINKFSSIIPLLVKNFRYEPRKAKRKNKLSDEQFNYDNQIEDDENFSDYYSDHYREQSNSLNDVN